MNENANFLSEVWQHVAERAAAVQALTLAKCAWASVTPSEMYIVLLALLANPSNSTHSTPFI